MLKDDLRVIRTYYKKGEAKSHLASLFSPEKYPDAQNNELARLKDIFYVLKGDCAHYSLITYTTESGDIIGAVLWYKTKSNICTLNDIVVLNQYQGNGMGKRLFNDFYSTIFGEGACSIKFYADLSSLDFYTRFGYKWLALSQSEQIPWTICRIQSDDALNDCKLFYAELINSEVNDYLILNELKKMFNKMALTVTKKKTIAAIDKINQHMIQYQLPTNTLESLFE